MKKVIWTGVIVLIVVAVYTMAFKGADVVGGFQKPVTAKPADNFVLTPVKTPVPVSTSTPAAPANATVVGSPSATPAIDTPAETPAAPAPTDQSSTDNTDPSPTVTCVGNTGNSTCEFNPAITQCLDNNTCGKDD